MSGMPTPRERPSREVPPRIVRGLLPEELAMLLGRGVAADSPQPPLPAQRSALPESAGHRAWDVFDEGDALVVVVDLPGIRKRDVLVALDRSVLVAEGGTHPGSGDVVRQYSRVGRQSGRFRRLLQLLFEVRTQGDHRALRARRTGSASASDGNARRAAAHPGAIAALCARSDSPAATMAGLAFPRGDRPAACCLHQVPGPAMAMAMAK